ncbi:MAG TPA: SurA N-terminal domain-containing protein [Caulobacteraceae bacterium]|nr:SurA N-terminal domain-containing protein [Caulobacteraceae bacterium]
MLAVVRSFSKTIFAKLLLVLLIVAMAGFGMSGVLQAQFSKDVIIAGDREVSPEQFVQMFDNQREQMKQRRGQDITREQMIEAGFHQRMLQELAAEESYLAWLGRIGVRPADELIVEQLRQSPRFFNPVTGAFDQTEFDNFLREAKMTRQQFDQTVRDGIAIEHFSRGMGAGVRLPRIYGAMQAAFGLERRDASWIAVTPQSVAQPAAPTDAQLQAFLTENSAQLRRPEYRELTVALFTPASVMGTVTVDETLIRRTYEFRKDALSQAERRTFVQIPVKTAQEAQRVIAGLRANQDPQAVARGIGAQPVTYQDRPRSAVPDRAVAQQAFTLPVGQVSAPIQGELGTRSVIKVLGVSPGRQVTFEEARPEIEAGLKREAAVQKVDDNVQAYERLRNSGVGMVEAARQTGGVVRDLPPVTAEGALPNGRPLGAPPALFAAGFALAAGSESDSIEDAGNGEYFAVRVRRVLPAGLPKLEEVKPQLTQAWMQREMVRRMEAKAQELAGRLRKGESLQAVAASAGLSVQTAKDIERGQNPQLGPQFLSEVFLKKANDVFVARMPSVAFAVGRVEAITTPPAALAARMAEDRRPQISNEYTGQMAELLRAATRNLIKPRVYPDRVNTALNIQEPAGGAVEGDAKK